MASATFSAPAARSALPLTLPPGLEVPTQDVFLNIADCADTCISECSTATPSEVDSDEVCSHNSPGAAALGSSLLQNQMLTTFRPPPGLIHPSEDVTAWRPLTVPTAHPDEIVERVQLTLEENIEPSDLGVLGVPSIGSVGHHLGMCKPCDFVNRGSCRQGVDCKFCHLCDREANKRRKNDKKSLINAVKSYQRGVAAQQRTSSATFQGSVLRFQL